MNSVELYATQNAQEHHTDRYEVVEIEPATPVLRRGNAFYIAVQFADNREFNPKEDRLKLVFTFGNEFFFLKYFASISVKSPKVLKKTMSRRGHIYKSKLRRLFRNLSEA